MTAVATVNALKQYFRLELPLKKIVHIGANTGQEVEPYDQAGIEGYHVEAHPEYFAEVAAQCGKSQRQKAVLACCDEISGRTVEFNVTNNGQSSSLLPLGRHALAYPHITVTDKIQLQTTTVDDLIEAGSLPSNPDLMVIDVQGAESRVIAGAHRLLDSGKLWGIQVEVALDSLYEGGPSFERLYAEHLKPKGYYLKHADFNLFGWTNALFLKRWWRLPGEDMTPLHHHVGLDLGDGKNIALDGQCSQSSLSPWSTHLEEAQTAVSGFPHGSYSFHTAVEANSWWKIEWSEARRIDEVLCFNRLDGDAEVRDRIIGSIFEYSPDGASWQMLHTVAGTVGGVDGNPLRLNVGPIEAKAFRVRQPRSVPLHFDHIRLLQKPAGSEPR